MGRLLPSGHQAARGHRQTIDVDGFSKRGGGVGYDLVIDQLGHQAQLDLYGMYDSGQQVTDTGIVQDVPKEIRYATLWENTLQLDPSMDHPDAGGLVLRFHVRHGLETGRLSQQT